MEWGYRMNEGVHNVLTTNNTSTAQPAFGISGYLLLHVEDADFQQKSFKSPIFTITGSSDPLNVLITFDRKAVQIGHPIIATLSITGGVPPYKVYDHALVGTYNEDKSDGLNDYVPVYNNIAVFVPLQGNHGDIHFFVSDAVGRDWAFSSSDFKISIMPIKPGDANSDGNVDIMDLVAIIDYIVSDTSPKSILNSDANGDDVIDIMDLVWIIDLIISG